MNGSRPSCAILAGPNGAGKSTIYKNLALPGVFVNADEVARGLDASNPEANSLKAGRLVLETLNRLIAARQDFVYETTLSSHQSVNLLRQVGESGYKTLMIFVALVSPDLHVQRVAQRVSRGGHHIPEPVIRRRYDVAFQNLTACVPLSETTMIFDNSAAGARLLLQVSGNTITHQHVDPQKSFDRRIAACVAAGLDIPVEAVLPPAG
ncbi:AAA family ATPase [Neorhizobium alkalisoli]|uniref:Putative ABC-type ATPase n=1 Tax=Neorhizobium alkalisoli TaxID=528178 RepID=A0A561QHA9_9HYPH|nr:AAA family ATPase [Neorhizobium alkalisoli]TWF49754.1 putative ABC-type ATPase [Neorhizobium alkalisoli]